MTNNARVGQPSVRKCVHTKHKSERERMEQGPPRRYDMNGRSQMLGDKTWILPKETNANRFIWDSYWLKIWKNHFCPSMGPNGRSVAMENSLNTLHNPDVYPGFRWNFQKTRLIAKICIEAQLTHFSWNRHPERGFPNFKVFSSCFSKTHSILFYNKESQYRKWSQKRRLKCIVKQFIFIVLCRGSQRDVVYLG